MQKLITQKTIDRFLSNEKYIGIYRQKDEVYQDYFPAILDKGVFYKVQERLQARRKGKRHTCDYLLSGKLYCGYCHQLMYGDSAKPRENKIYSYYICSTNKNNAGKCKKHTVHKDWLEQLIVENTLRYIFEPERMKHIIENLSKIILDKAKSDNTLAILQKKSQSLQNQINNILEAIKNGNALKSLTQELSNLENEQKIVSQQIEKTKYLKSLELTPQKIEFLFEKIKNEPDKEKQKNIILKNFVNYVVLYNDKIEIGYNLSNDNVQIIKLESDNDDNNNSSSGGNETSIIASDKSENGSPQAIKTDFLSVFSLFCKQNKYTRCVCRLCWLLALWARRHHFPIGIYLSFIL